MQRVMSGQLGQAKHVGIRDRNESEGPDKQGLITKQQRSRDQKKDGLSVPVLEAEF